MSMSVFLGVTNIIIMAFVTEFNARSLILTIVAVGVVLIGFGFVLYRLKPINNLIQLLNDVKNGNMNVNINRSALLTDEIGILTNDVFDLAQVNLNLIDDINKLAHEFDKQGNIDYRIDSNRYDNSFKVLVQQVNGIIDNQVSDILPVIDCINKLAEGNFNVTIRDMPGKKAILPQSIREVASKLNELYESTIYMARKASDGNLDVTIDHSKFKGSWAELISALNTLLVSIREPLSSIEISLLEMSEGNFEISQRDRKFKGVFETARKAVHDTETETLAYVDEIANVLEHMAQGDLTVSIQREYKGSYAPIKSALTTILNSLNLTLSDIQGAAALISEGTGHMSNSALHLAMGAEKQAAALEELNSTIEIIHEKAAQTSESARSAKQSVVRSQEFSIQGGEAVKSMNATMNKVQSSSQSISKIIDVITSIAFQTNLLALNASVEAARAGEHGKGFSVVADEVRTLAGRSQKSASDTTEIIGNDTNTVESGIKAAADVASSFDTIANNINEISDLISNIADISNEQLKSISTINESVTEITKVVSENSAMSEESATALSELDSQATLLQQKVEYFRLR